MFLNNPEDKMMFVNNNKDPITVIQYKYHEGEFGKLLNGAFTDFTKYEKKITIFTREKPVTVNREPLVVFSPLLRSVLDSLSCCSAPSLSLPDCSSSALEHLCRILQSGVTDFHGELNTAEIIVAAQCLQIDLTNFEYVKREPKILATKIEDKNSKVGQTNLSAAEGDDESDSDLDETAVDDYGEDEDLNEDMETDDVSSASKVTDEIDSFLKLKSQMQNLLDEDDNTEQETLDEKAEDRSFTKKSKPAKFRIPKKTAGEVPRKENPVPLKKGQGVAPSSYQAGNSSNQQNSSAARPRMAPQAQQSSQNWTPVLPMAPQAPFRHNPPMNRPPHPGQMQPQLMRAQLPPRHFNPQMMSTPPPRLPTTRFNTDGYEDSLTIGQPLPLTPRPQPAGLWAQSATKPLSNLGSNPTSAPVASGQHPRTLPSQELPGSVSSPGTVACQICQKTTPSLATMWQHYARVHVFAELKTDYSFMANIATKSCNECGSAFKAVDALFLHIGTVHRKVNEILQKKGLACLDMPMRTKK